MARAPASWAADSAAPFAKADAPTSFDRWSVITDPGGRGLTLRSEAGTPAVLLARAVVLKPPTRWNGDPTQPLRCTLQGAELISWVTELEKWLVDKIPGVGGEARSAVHTNLFAETFLKTKLGGMTRYFDAAGAQLDALDVQPGQAVWVLLALRPYCMGGGKGLSLHILALQPA